HIVAVKPSHGANCELARQIVAQIKKPLQAARTFAPPPLLAKDGDAAKAESGTAAAPNVVMDTEKVLSYLPHRYPFMMVDKIVEISETRIVGVKNITFNEPYFQGHFPGHPIMPGVLQLEAMAQVAGLLTIIRTENVGKVAYFMSADNVKWRKPVKPGDTLFIEIDVTKARGKIGRAKGVCKVNGEVVSEAEMAFVIADRE
ncbi:MAG TPA: 3-hydroxyacyl-ACP dehydratase FabZ, partial [Verrucomicrobiae bacterium]